MLLFVEGNIGTGKSTFLQSCRSYTFDNFNRVLTVPESVDAWMHKEPALNNNSIFDLFYSDKKRYCYSFQSYVLLSRVAGIIEAIKQSGDDPAALIVCERSHFTDLKVFAECLVDNGDMSPEEMLIYRKWHNIVSDLLAEYTKAHAVGVIYLKADPETSFERIQVRSRRGESDNIDMEYIRQLHDRHEAWLTKGGGVGVGGNNMLVVDANPDCIRDVQAAKEMQRVVTGFVNALSS
jgi:deoxycitidine kinase